MSALLTANCLWLIKMFNWVFNAASAPKTIWLIYLCQWNSAENHWIPLILNSSCSETTKDQLPKQIHYMHRFYCDIKQKLCFPHKKELHVDEYVPYAVFKKCASSFLLLSAETNMVLCSGRSHWYHKIAWVQLHTNLRKSPMSISWYQTVPTIIPFPHTGNVNSNPVCYPPQFPIRPDEEITSVNICHC